MALFRRFPHLISLLLSLRYMAAHKSRTALTGLGIMLGVGVVLAVNITNASLMASFDAVFDEAGGKADLTVLDKARGGDGFDIALLDTVRRYEAVIAVAPVVQAFTLLADDLNTWQAGATVTGTQAAGSALQVLGVDAEMDHAVRDYNLVEGRFLEPGERRYSVVLVQDYAEDKGYALGDDLPILIPGTSVPVRLRVVGLIEQSGAGMINGGAVAFVPLSVAQELFARGGRLDRIDVVLSEEVAESPTLLAEAKEGLEATLGEDVRVVYPGSRGEELAKRMASYRLGLDLFSLVAMFVGGFLIYNTFAMNVAERTRNIGLLKAIGLTRRQILMLMLTEAVVLSVVGSVLGLMLGVGMAFGMATTVGMAAGTPVMGLTVPTVGFVRSLAIGLGVTLVSAMWPALQATQISPLEALRARAKVEAGRWRHLSWRFGPLLVLVAYLVFNYLPLRESVSWPIVSSSALLFFFGAAFCVPMTDRPLGRLLKPRVARLFGHVGKIGTSNIDRAQTRTLITIATLMLGIATNIGTVSLGDSFRHDLSRWTEAALGGDLLVYSPVRLKHRIAQRLAAIEGVAVVSAERIVEVWTSGAAYEDEILFVAIEPRTRRQISEFLFEEVPEGSEDLAFARFEQGDAVFVSTGLAGRYHLEIGDHVTLDTPRGRRDFEVAGIVLDFSGNGLMVFGRWEDLRRYFGVDDVDRFLLKLEPGYQASEVRERIEAQLGDRLNLVVEVVDELLRSVLEIVDQSFLMFDTLALIVVSVSALGVVNTMAISVLERRREIAVLRSIGLTRRQVVRMVLAEAAVLGSLGGVLGLAFGIVLARMFIRVVQHLVDYELTMVISPRVLISSVLIALVVSQLAALVPALRASRGQIVESLHEE